MAGESVLQNILENARKDLLELSTRNRLLNTTRGKSSSSRLEIVEEISDEVFRLLVTDEKAMSFLPRAEAESSPEPNDGQPHLVQPGDDESDANEIAERRADAMLQTPLASETLQKYLLKLFYDARTYEEEQGVSILYLAVGFLKWYEDPKSDRERFAPLLLIPVALDRTSASSRFKIRYSGDDIATNLSLQARLRSDFGIELPPVADSDDFTPSGYFTTVANAIKSQARWSVAPNDIVLSFFSFSKFLMYRDLAGENWPSDRPLENNALITSLLRSGFSDDSPLCGDDDKIDQLLDLKKLVHVVDADSSQALVIEETNRGRNLVIQGPPGTGKSQTIANVIAAAVKAGKTVLFVAEKMAALDVVKRRLATVGLDGMCLELHSNKANKKNVLQELERTLQLGKPVVDDVERHCGELTRCRDQINRHLELIHSPAAPCGLTAFQVIGQLVRLRADGTRPPGFKLIDPLTWSRSEFQSRVNLLHELAERIEEIGVPSQSVWIGVKLDVVLPTDVDRITSSCDELSARLERLNGAAAQLATILNVPQPTNASGVSGVARLAQKIALAPPMDRTSMASGAWVQRRSEISELIRALESLSQSRVALAGEVVDAAWDVDVTTTRRSLAGHGRSWFRFLNRGYREAQATLRGLLVGELPKPLEERLSIVDRLLVAQKARNAIGDEAGKTLGKQAFGSHWAGEKSDWSLFARISQWETECREAKIDPEFRQIIAALNETPDLREPLGVIREELKRSVDDLKFLFQTLKLDVQSALSSKDLLAVPLQELIDKLRHWKRSPEELSRWVGYSVRRQSLESIGLGELLAEMHSGATGSTEAVNRFEMAYFESILREIFRREPALASFSGASHEQLLQKFRKLDAERIEIARHEVALAHFLRLPKHASDVGEIGVVRREIQKRRRHLPIRRLLADAGRAVLAIKPVFMMSPISIAQYLEPGCIEFDLLLIDEASQVPPVDALGAVARAKQIVVVGDSKQLPPTTFFNRMLGDEANEAEDEQGTSASDMESILGLCCAQNVPQRMLSWHYRSRHHSLIAVSNREFYDDRLYVIPSPSQAGPGQGLTFHFVSDGIFDRGGSATNRIEARRVAEAVMDHARHRPEQSLMVGTFSVAQRDAILNELEPMRRSDPSLEHFFMASKDERFDVKNLENIQGDERDVVFISVGYGKDAENFMAMSFGPLSNDGGERRLNVLITRARDCCCVFSSIRPDDIDLHRAKARGAQALKTFLKYAESGLLDTGTHHGEAHDSEFERQVAKALAAQGFQTDPQVGVAGFFIDLAVVDPDRPGRYMLGIECDGANYHRSRSARDRDRLRQTVLESRGWQIHRIWSTDWFQRPEEQLGKAVAAIERARTTPREPRSESSQDSSTIDATAQSSEDDARQPMIARELPRPAHADAINHFKAVPYQIATFRIESTQEIHELSAADLARVVSRIIDIEGPIHRDEIARRVTQLWGLKRAGQRICDSVERALVALPKGSVRVNDSNFFASAGLAEIPVRDRGEVSSATLRKPEMLPPAEIRKALWAIVEVHFGITIADAVVEIARLLGFKATSPQLKEVITKEIDLLIALSHVVNRSNKLYPGESALVRS